MKNTKILVILIILLAAGTGGYLIYKSNRIKINSSSSDTKIIQTPQTATSTSTYTPEKTPIKEYKVPILMYHYIRDFNDPNDKIGTNLSVSPTNFEKQLKWLKDNDYQTVNPDYLLTPYALPHKPVILTFDDGYRDAYEQAYPILKKYQVYGTFYLITDSVGAPYYLTWAMAKEMKDAGMNFGSHTVNHPDLRNVTDTKLIIELTDSKKKIENKLGTVIVDFCYPSGKYDDRTIPKLKEFGYRTAVTTHTGVANQNSNIFELPRIRIQDDSNLASLLK